MTCMVCKQDLETRYIDLYVFGSEGLRVCRPCENEISNNILQLTLKKQDERKQNYLKRKARK